jgi:LysR family transcriptional regulator, glycine cleavage system transcriptional activator
MNLLHIANMRTLPPFDGLIAFDAAIRYRSMTLAATELGLTQSAVSHRLKKLEVFIGAQLFNRTAIGLSPTSAGASLLEGLGKLLDEMAALRARSRAAIRPATLKVGIGSALAQHWLVRRLPRFAASYPGIGLELVAIETEIQARAADVDVQILWLPKGVARATSTQRPLFDERVFPVAVRRILPGGKPLRDPTELRNLPILHKGAVGRNDGAEWSWHAWFERLGLGSHVPVGLRFDTLSLALAAALEGTGAVLARSLLVHDAIAERRLCRVLPRSWDLPSGKAHFVRWPGVLSGDKRVASFTAWLAKEAAAVSDG